MGLFGSGRLWYIVYFNFAPNMILFSENVILVGIEMGVIGSVTGVMNSIKNE